MDVDVVTKIKQYIDALNKRILESPKIKAVIEGRVDLKELSGLDLLKKGAQGDEEAFNKFMQLIQANPDLAKSIMELVVAMFTLLPIEHGQITTQNGRQVIEVMKRKVYMLSKQGLVLMCVPVLRDECPQQFAELVSEFIVKYKGTEIFNKVCQTCQTA